MAPPTMNPSAVSTGSGLGSPKLMTLFLSIIERSKRSHFLNFFFENFWKLNFENFRGSSSMTRKIEKIEKNQIFCRESYFYWLNLFCICSQLSFEVYSSSVAQNFKFQIFLAWKIRFLIFVVWRLIAPKLYYIGGCFWCLWKAKDQNIYLRACLWLLVAPELRKRGGAIMAPPMEQRHSRAHGI